MTKLKLKMRAVGTVRAPDGTVKQVVLQAELPLKEVSNGNNTKRSS